MSSASVLRALSDVAGAELKHFALVRCLHGEYDEELMYMCLGKHAMYLIDDEMIGAGSNGLLYSCRYSSLERCEVDSESQDLFALFFLDRTPLHDTQEEDAEPSGKKGEVEGPERIQDVDYFPQRLLFRSADRARLRAELEIYFRTDFMYQHWQLPSAPFVVETEGSLLPASSPSRHAALTSSAALELNVARLAGYSFSYPRDYGFAGGVSASTERGADSGFPSGIAGPTTKTQSILSAASAASLGAIASARYARTSGKTRTVGSGTSSALPSLLEVIVHDRYPLTEGRLALSAGSERQAQDAANHYMRFIGDQVVDYRIIGRPQRYQRRQSGASEDLASYTCWRLHMRTAKHRHNTSLSLSLSHRNVHIYVLQRKFIPPNMDQFQTIVVIGCSGHLDSTMRSSVELVANSLRCSAKATTGDRLVVQTKANALMLDEELYRWYAHNLEPPVVPNAATLALAFCQSIMAALRRAKVLLRPANQQSRPDAHGTATEKVAADPFEYSQRLEHQLPGLSSKYVDDELAREWRTRVWRYLAYCVDGGLMPGELDIALLASTVQQHSEQLQNISQVLQTLLYFRPTHGDFQQTPFALKIADDRMMQDFTFNERVMRKLLQSGYIKWALDATNHDLEYPRFIVRLLQCGRDRVRWGHSLQFMVCEHLVRCSVAPVAASGGAGAMRRVGPGGGAVTAGPRGAAPLSDFSLQTIVPALIDLLNDPGSSEKVQVLAVSCLVNFTRNNEVFKTKVMAGGAFRRGAIESICRFLQSKNDDLVKHSVSLLNNCTKKEQYRGQIAKFRAVEALLRLIKRNDFQPFYRPIQILTQTAAVLGNLASDSHLREQITRSLGYTNKLLDDQDAQVRIPKAIDELVALLEDRENIFQAQNQYASLRVTVIYALKNLCIKHVDNKVNVGLLAIPTLVGIVTQTSQTSDIEHILIDVTLRCLYVLSFHRKNCFLLRKHEIDKVLQGKEGASFSEFRVQIQRKVIESLEPGAATRT